MKDSVGVRMLEIFKTIVPETFKSPVKELLLRQNLNAAISKLKNLGVAEKIESGLLQKLSTNWGNEAYSADMDYLDKLVSLSSEVPGAILECGSGLTTIILGAIAGRRGTRVFSLEHDVEWYQRVQTNLTKHQLQAVHLQCAPLKDYGGFSWYRPVFDKLPKQFSLVVCDGPPETTPGGRYGLLPVMKDYLNSSSIILLDDADTEIGSNVLGSWAKEQEIEVALISKIAGTFAEVRIGQSDPSE